MLFWFDGVMRISGASAASSAIACSSASIAPQVPRPAYRGSRLGLTLARQENGFASRLGRPEAASRRQDTPTGARFSGAPRGAWTWLTFSPEDARSYRTISMLRQTVFWRDSRGRGRPR